MVKLEKVIKGEKPMRRVRVEREMPFAKVGEVFDTGNYPSFGLQVVFEGCVLGKEQIDKLIKDGWLSYVEEPKSLDNILHESLYQYIGSSGCLALERKIRTHALEVFDRAVETKDLCGCANCKDIYRTIRQALSEGK